MLRNPVEENADLSKTKNNSIDSDLVNSTLYDSKSDNSEFDNSKSDNSEFDNSKSDNSEFDNSKSDNSEFDNSKSDNSEFDNSKSDNSEFDNSEFDNSEFDNYEFDNSESANIELNNLEFEDSDSEDSSLFNDCDFNKLIKIEEVKPDLSINNSENLSDSYEIYITKKNKFDPKVGKITTGFSLQINVIQNNESFVIEFFIASFEKTYHIDYGDIKYSLIDFFNDVDKIKKSKLHKLDTIHYNKIKSKIKLKNLWITENGDIVIRSKIKVNSLSIKTPYSVIFINNVQSKNMNIEANSLRFINSDATIDSLIFKMKDLRKKRDLLPKGLYINNKSKLTLTELNVEDGIFLNNGTAIMNGEANFNKVSLLNNGEIKFNGKNTIFNDSLTLYNSNKGSIISNKNVFCKAKTIMNKGLMNIETMNLESISLKDKVEKVEMYNDNSLNIKNIVINGELLVNAESINFENKIEFIGEESCISTSNDTYEISTSEIRCNSEAVNIERGIINIDKIVAKSNSNLKLKCNMPSLKSIEIEESSELIIDKDCYVPVLNEINNEGCAFIHSPTPALSTIKNSKNGKLYIYDISIDSMEKFKDLYGEVSIKFNSLNEEKMVLQNDIKLTILSGSNLEHVNEISLKNESKLNIESDVVLENMKDLNISSGSECIIEKNCNISNLTNIDNKGSINLKVPLLKLQSVFNREGGSLQFQDKVEIREKNFNKDDISMDMHLKNLINKSIALYNEGEIKINIPSSEGMNILGSYFGTELSKINIEHGFLLVKGIFTNKGLVCAPDILRITIGEDITIENRDSINTDNIQSNLDYSGIIDKLGKMQSENGINFINKSKNIKIDNSFMPIINNNLKPLIINSTSEIDFITTINWNVDLNLIIPNYNGYHNLILKSLVVETHQFSNNMNITTNDGIKIKADTFNNKGKIMSKRDISLMIRDELKNNGGGKIQKNVPETIQWSTFDSETKVITNNSEVIYRDIYEEDLNEVGIIYSEEELKIECTELDNCFGIISSLKNITINCSNKIKNICGIIYSNRKLELFGNFLENGYKINGKEFISIDGSKPIFEERKENYQEWVKSGYNKWDGDLGKIIGRKIWEDTSHYETRTRTITIQTGYETIKINSTSAEYPGYIFCKDDLIINIINEPSYFGFIASGHDIIYNNDPYNILNFNDYGKILSNIDIYLKLEEIPLYAQVLSKIGNININFESNS